jgi:hypothetical protein
MQIGTSTTRYLEFTFFRDQEVNEHKRQKLEDKKLKKSGSSNRDTTKPSAGDTSTPSSNSNMPNQYARVKNAVKGEDDIQDQAIDTYDFVDEYLEDAIKSSDHCEEIDISH